jgi:transcriptional regulator GlxA family with amidase domain
MLADVAHSNPRSIQTGFKKCFKMTPTQYIRSYRLDIAHEKLKRAAITGLSVAEIAYSCGFNDQSKFARYYRAKFGQLPSETTR